MVESSSQLSYQTTMPEYPDVSYQTWAQRYGGHASTRWGQSIQAWAQGYPDYNTWRTNTLDQYNAQLNAYNTWLSSGAGMRASAESGNYNPSYFDAGSAQASPLNYQEGVAPSSGFSEMAQGISGIFQFIQALQGMRMLSAQIGGQELKNKAQEINNRYLDSLLTGRLAGLNFSNDKRQFELEQLFYPRWSKYPELWKGGAFSPYGRGTYDLRDADLGLGYQRQVKDLSMMDAAISLRKDQAALVRASKKEKNWFYDNVLPIQKKILESTSGLVKGELDFQPIEQKIRKAGAIAGISLSVINAAINAVKAFSPGGFAANLLGGGFNPGGSSSSSSNPGWDVSTGAWYGPYGN